MTTTLTIQTREGRKRVTIDESCLTISQLKSSIEDQLGIPTPNQALSVEQKILAVKTREGLLEYTIPDPNKTLAELELSHGSVVYMANLDSVDPRNHNQPKVGSLDHTNHEETSQISGTHRAFNARHSVIIEDSTLSTAENAGNRNGSASARATGQQHRPSITGTVAAFNSETGSLTIKRSTISTAKDSGNS